ncbi:hypothetical protein A4U61_05775 [Streptomyces sp. H-KF8]|uniref:hypothetical protein n=1 Tax=Streptomyces sp. H-KF8 TaxID=1727216 RepID=UPI0007EE1EBD|nr:hypothetical protein [Streptomyces sp. H-KF8]OBQ53658.1 hypothetical protein A4U61_05775 [Streptomyces sp. H-KF8]
MDIDGTRVPAAGADGVTGGAPTARPAGRGARPAPAGGDPRRPAAAAAAAAAAADDDATAVDAEPPRTAPDGTPVVGQHAR